MQLDVVGLGRNTARLIGHAVDDPLEIAASNVASKSALSYASFGAASHCSQRRPGQELQFSSGVLKQEETYGA